MIRLRPWFLIALSFLVAACDPAEAPRADPAPTGEVQADQASEATEPEEREPEELEEERDLNPWVRERPAWLGTRVLPLGSNGTAEAQPTPRILRNRRFATIDLFPPPDEDGFKASISAVPPRILQRSTWRNRCPVPSDELAYLKLTFRGFDRRSHVGDMIVHSSVAEDVVSAFETLYEERFPIEELRVITMRELRRQQRAPTGDGNVTTSFVCRPTTGGSGWSEHAYGLAVDVNPFHNPYLRGEAVIPELATAYTNRSRRRPGMMFEGDAVTRAFDAIGWSWGGRWSNSKDWMHFSLSGR